MLQVGIKADVQQKELCTHFQSSLHPSWFIEMCACSKDLKFVWANDTFMTGVD